jgi:hypothetical protein
MKDKLLKAMLNNVEKIQFYYENYNLETKIGCIRLFKNQKYIIEKVEIRKGTWFRKALYERERRYIQEYHYEITFNGMKFEVEESEYNKIKKKRGKYLLKRQSEELDKLIKVV